MTDPILEVWTIYERPTDYPTGYVLRRTVVRPGEITPDVVAVYGPSAAAVRALLPDGLCCVQRPGMDPDPHIFEVWM